ncbi:MAG: glycosyltransferase family 39 protein [Candidatus Omnitrophica bacterium]|nr:glycosyltransferase family 39 protein [Candidatus Omnitrophota bacterium]
MKKIFKEYPLVILLIIAALLIFPNLGNSYLWQDEGETAFIAKNTLKVGYPLAYDGVNKPQTMEMYEKTSPQQWYKEPYRYAPWLQFYITAASFKLFGLNTHAARLPFAIFGLFSIMLIWFLSEEIFAQRTISIIATLSCVVCIPYILHIRQCHWYVLVSFFTLWALLSYLQMLKKKRYSTLGLILSGILLFHSNHGIFIPVFLGIGLHYLTFAAKELKITSLMIAAIVIAIFCFPFLYLLSGSEFAAGFDTVHIRHQIEYYMRMINKWVFPWAALFNIWLFASIFKRRFKWFLKSQPQGVYLLICVIFTTILFLIIPKVRAFRYINHLIPLLLILQARILLGWIKSSKKLATIGIALILFTNVFTMGAPFLKPIRILLTEYIYELTHDYDGPVEGIVVYLKENAKPGDTVKINYGDLPLMFYTDLRVDNRPFRETETYPQWIVYRRDWVGSDFFKTDYGKKVLAGYEKIVLDYPDTRWHNRPDPNEHRFRTAGQQPKLEIYKKR